MFGHLPTLLMSLLRRKPDESIGLILAAMLKGLVVANMLTVALWNQVQMQERQSHSLIVHTWFNIITVESLDSACKPFLFPTFRQFWDGKSR